MTIRPITLRPWQVRAALDGRLRRIVVPLKVQPPGDWRPVPGLVEIHRCDEWGEPVEPRTKRDVLGMGFTEADGSCGFVMPYAPGDSLYGRETWHPTLLGDWPFVEYKTDSGGDEYLGNSRPITIDQFDRVDSERRGWRSPVTMPRWASRWTLVVESVKVERVQDATEEDARAEGFTAHGPGLCTEDPDDYLGCYSARTALLKEWSRRCRAEDWCAVARVRVERRGVGR